VAILQNKQETVKTEVFLRFCADFKNPNGIQINEKTEKIGLGALETPKG